MLSTLYLFPLNSPFHHVLVSVFHVKCFPHSYSCLMFKSQALKSYICYVWLVSFTENALIGIQSFPLGMGQLSIPEGKSIMKNFKLMYQFHLKLGLRNLIFCFWETLNIRDYINKIYIPNRIDILSILSYLLQVSFFKTALLRYSLQNKYFIHD